MSKIIIVAGQEVNARIAPMVDHKRRSREVSIEMGDGLFHTFKEGTKEAELAFTLGSNRALSEHFSGGNYAFYEEGLIDFDVDGRFHHPQGLVDEYCEILGISKKGKDVGTRFAQARGTHQDFYLGGREERMDAQFKTEGAGGAHQIIATVQWSPFAETISLLATDLRIACSNGMAVSKVTDNNQVLLTNDLETNLSIATNGFMSKVERGMRNRYSQLKDKAITLGQAKTLLEILKRASEVSFVPQEDRQVLAKMAYQVYNSILELYTTKTINDNAYRGAPTLIGAIETVDILTQIVSNHLPNINDSYYTVRQSVNNLINEIMFTRDKTFTLPELGFDSEFDADQVYYGGFEGR